MQKEHTYHRVVAAERLRRRLAAFATSPVAAQRAGTEGVEGAGSAEGAEGAVPVLVEAPSEASAFADAVRTSGGPGGGAAGATLLTLRLLPALGLGFGGTAASVETRQSASQPQRTFKRGVASRRKRPR